METETTSMWQQVAKDKKGWIVVAASVVLNLIRNGMTFGFGVFIAELKVVYERSMAELDWIGVLVICLSNLLSPVTFFILKKAPVKGYFICSLLGSLLQAISCISSSFVTYVPWMFITFSLLFGFGSSLVLISSSLVISTFFPPTHPHHVFATATFQCAFPIATLTYSALYSWLIKVTSLETAFRIAGIKAFVIGIVCSSLFLLKKSSYNGNESKTNIMEEEEGEEGGGDNGKTTEEVYKTQPDEISVSLEKEEAKWLDVCRRPERVCWLSGLFLIFATQIVPIFNLPHYMEERGYDKVESSLPVTLLSFFETLGYVVLALIGNRLKGRLVYINILSCLGFTIVLLIWPSANPSYAVIMVFSSFMGVFLSMSFIYMYAGSAEAMDMNIDIAWTASCFFSGVGSLLSPIISGAVYDWRHSYSDVFYVVGAVCLVNFLIFVGIPVARRYRMKSLGYENIE